MKKFSKIIALAMVGALAFGLVGCGAKDSEEKDTLIMATNAEFPPYEYYKGQDIVGIDVEIAQEIAKYLKCEIKIEDMEFKGVLAAVQSGKADFALAGLTDNEERRQNVDFSESYATGVQVILVREGSPIKTPDDLKGKIVGVQEATTSDIYITEDLGEEFVERYPKGADAVQALLSGKIDAVVIDNEPAKSFKDSKEGLAILDSEYVTEDYAIAVQKGNTKMMEKINEAIKALKADGTIQKILDKYISAN